MSSEQRMQPSDFRTIALAQLPTNEVYGWMIRAIAPRPIAWVSTCDAEGHSNLAPFSYFNGVCSAPPTLAVSVANRADGSKKDTLRNIEATGEFVVNIVPYALADPMVQSSVEYPPEVSEFAVTGLAELPSQQVRPPRVAAAPIQLECRLDQIVRVGDGPSAGNLILGRILLLHVQEQVLDDRGKIDHGQVDSIGRMGGLEYCRTTERFVVRPGTNS